MKKVKAKSQKKKTAVKKKPSAALNPAQLYKPDPNRLSLAAALSALKDNEALLPYPGFEKDYSLAVGMANTLPYAEFKNLMDMVHIPVAMKKDLAGLCEIKNRKSDSLRMQDLVQTAFASEIAGGQSGLFHTACSLAVDSAKGSGLPVDMIGDYALIAGSIHQRIIENCPVKDSDHPLFRQEMQKSEAQKDIPYENLIQTSDLLNSMV